MNHSFLVYLIKNIGKKMFTNLLFFLQLIGHFIITRNKNGKIKSIKKTKYCKNIKNFNEEIEFFFDESKQASEIYGNILL